MEDHEGTDIEIMNEAVSNFPPLLIACAYDQLEVVKLFAYYKYLELYESYINTNVSA